MPANVETNGETAALKKRKRGKDDEARRTNKKPRAKAKGKNGVQDALVKRGNSVDPELEDADASALQLQEWSAPPRWTVSKPMGGRMVDIDPIFSQDEQHLIITYNTSIQVYSASDSLLIRRIALPQASRVVSTALSKQDDSFIWVACSAGEIFHIDWTNGSGAETPFANLNTGILDMVVELSPDSKRTEDIFLVSEGGKEPRACLYNQQSLVNRKGRLLHRMEKKLTQLRATTDLRVIVLAADSTIHVGFSSTKKPKSLDEMKYRFFSFETMDVITCLDIRTSRSDRGSKAETMPAVDLVVGGARGFVFRYNDLLLNTHSKTTNPEAPPVIKPVQYHWHRRAVHSVKWSLDGNYLISGGADAVLALRQLDTNREEFLPSLGAGVENIVVSPSGSSYAVHLEDNSTMILSTAEMTPTAYVSGIQSLVLSDEPSKESLVRRVWEPVDDISSPLAATTNPMDPSQLLVCVGNGQRSAQTEDAPSTPLVQAFDLSTFQSISKHALARTNPTTHNITSQGFPITDPRVTHLAFSHNGKWLASIDEWQPPPRDVEPIAKGLQHVSNACQERREILLKFWEVGSDPSAPPQLVTRVNEAHRTEKLEKIFGLASDPTSTRFATIGDDGRVKLWSPRQRRLDGLAETGPEGQALKVWVCSQSITLEERILHDDPAEENSLSRSGAITFSEDGSVLFAAFGDPADATVYMINVETGEIHNKLSGLFRGDVRAIEVLSSCLIMLSEDLTVYDIVADRLRYGFSLNDMPRPAFQLTQLAVNHQSQSFALAVPLVGQQQTKLKKSNTSELTVFSIQDSQPQFVRVFPHVITSILPATGSPGFIVVDSAAQIYSITEGTEPIPMVQPLADMNLDKVPAELTNGQHLDEDEAASDDEMQEVQEDVDMVDDDDIHAAVVAPQRLADIFDAAPAFAMPPIEDIFNQVAKLFTAPPIASSAGL